VRRALDADANLPEAHVAQGIIHRIEGNPAGVLDAIRAAQKLDSNDPEIMLWVGRSYMSLNRPLDAIGVLERALALRPRDYRLLSAFSDCSDMLGRKDVVANMLVRIREVLTDELERKPDNVYARGMFSIVLAQSGDHAAGAVQAERAIAEAPDDGTTLYNAACTFTYAGDHARAIQLLRDMVRSHPGFPRDWVRHDPDFAPLRPYPEFVELFGRPE
jgi:tetratricopeptide (TPR) repeat protein